MIRTATPDDTAAIVGLAVSSGLFPADGAGDVETEIAAHFADPGAGRRCLIDDGEGDPVAVALYQPITATDRAWYLTMIGVRADRQGHGLGTAVLDRVEADLRSRGQRLLLVETSGTPDFARTRAFYAGCGYTEEARVRDFYEAGDDMVVFHKAL